MFLIRVEFPDEDKYAFVTNELGIVRKYNDVSKALEGAREFEGIAKTTILEVTDDCDLQRIEWVGL